MSLQGKVCIVTGASSGIGQAIAILFASKGASLVLCGRSKSRLENTVDQCRKAVRERHIGCHSNSVRHDDNNYDDEEDKKKKSSSFVTVLGDLTDSEVRGRICKAAVDEFGRIDVLVANAGILGQPVSLEDATEDVYDEVMNTDVKAVFFLIQAAVPWLEKSQGSVVCMSSTASAISGDALIYHMAKASLDHMVRCLATSLGPKGIRINSVNPTFVQTRLLRSIMPHLLLESSDSESSSRQDHDDTTTTTTNSNDNDDDDDDDDNHGDNQQEPQQQQPPVLSDPFTQSKHALHPLQGRCATTQEVARVVAFLAGGEASFVTGQNVFVDGGISRTCRAFEN